MNLGELCEPLFLRICVITRAARQGGNLQFEKVRGDVERVLDQMRSRAMSEQPLRAQYEKVELALLLFVDSAIADSGPPLAEEWNRKRLASERGEPVANDRFWALLDETLRDESAEGTERLAVFYTCIGLGFGRARAADPERARQKMLLCLERLKDTVDGDLHGRLCPDAYRRADTRDLSTPLCQKAIGVGVVLLAGIGVALSILLAVLGVAWLVAGRASDGVKMVCGAALSAAAGLSLLEWRRRGRAAEMERAILDLGPTDSAGISSASRRAALDDMARSRRDAVKRLQSAGYNLHRSPWYLLVCECEVGMTTFIRHSCLGFPAGLHGPLDLLSCFDDWWFTDRAVIVGTSPMRALSPDGSPDRGTLQQFLAMLREYRPHRPISGLILLLRAGSLILDQPDQAGRNAGAMAKTVEAIREGVQARFPVFVVVNQCDLLAGFREFVQHITDPGLQQQILGWSNPRPIHAPFEPWPVAEAVDAVCDRLRRRVRRLLLEGVVSSAPDPLRGAETDALYAFPDSLRRLAPPIASYLEAALGGVGRRDERLFLRGIYFTYTPGKGNGPALDKDVAETLGIPLYELPVPPSAGGPGWHERDGGPPYFLRDMFLEKIFREKGLVVRP